jgi:hypothetical protein
MRNRTRAAVPGTAEQYRPRQESNLRPAILGVPYFYCAKKASRVARFFLFYIRPRSIELVTQANSTNPDVFDRRGIIARRVEGVLAEVAERLGTEPEIVIVGIFDASAMKT